MCYLFHPIQPPVDRGSWRLTLNPVNTGAIYSLIPDFGKVRNTFLELVTYLGNEPPIHSKEHSAITSGTSIERMQFVSYNLYRMKLLPPPYDTQCSTSSEVLFCKQNCYSESAKRINRLSHGVMHSVPSVHRIVQYTDLNNKSINDYWVSLEDKCYKKCQRTICEYNYTQTTLGCAVDRSEFKLELVITTSQNPVTTQVAIVRVTFYDLLYQILCSLSFWIGYAFPLKK